MFLKYCKKHDIYHLLSECPVCKGERTVKSLDDVDTRERLKTFSDLDIPVLVMCPPIIQKLYIDNNVWMEQFDEQMKKYFSYEKLFLQWYQIWQTLSMEALCLTLPTDPTLQDQCYDEQTEILTDQGWKFFKDLDGTEKVATLNPHTGKLEYQKPIAYQKYYYKGKMYHILTQHTDLLVTPTHKIYARKNFEKDFHLYEMEKVYGSRLSFRVAPDGFDGDTPNEFVFSFERRGRREEVKVPIDLFIRLFAWMITEGHVDTYAKEKYGANRLVLTQKKEENKPEIRKLLSEVGSIFGFSYNEWGDRRFIFRNKGIFEYFKQFGKHKEKFIPQEIKNWDSTLLRKLLYWLVKGDGSIRGNTWTYTTSSKRLADDVQEIALKCGYRAKLTSHRNHVNNTIYSVVINVNRKFSEISPDRVFVEDYEGYVYDVTVPKYHILLVRRNGKACFSGNCWVNSFVWLPHVEEPTIVLSNFKAEGRSREIDIAKTFLETCGYKTYQIPDPEWFFEGFPDLKWLYDNIYVAGFGERTTEQALDWIAEKFDCKIIKVARTTPENYHADTVLCPISPTKVMCVIPDCDKKALKELEKYAEIIPIEDKKLGEYCITNNIVIGYTIYAGTYLDVFEPDTEDWEIEMRKLEKLQEIAINHGYDLVVFETGQFLAFGAALSCTATPLNYGNQWTSQKVWSEYGNK